jgi:hypothetical protein
MRMMQTKYKEDYVRCNTRVMSVWVSRSSGSVDRSETPELHHTIADQQEQDRHEDEYRRQSHTCWCVRDVSISTDVGLIMDCTRTRPVIHTDALIIRHAHTGRTTQASAATR